MATEMPGTSFAAPAQSQERKRGQNDDSESEDVGGKKPKRSGEYTAGRLKNSLHGDSYQLKLLTLFAKRGLQRNCGVQLATEMMDAGIFDDVVFYYTKDPNEKMIYLLQAKHVKDETKKITYGDLLSEDKTATFNLKEYFISYRKIKKNPLFQGYELKKFVISTNIDFNENVKGFKPSEWKDDILHFKDCECKKKQKFLKLDTSKSSEIEQLTRLKSTLIRTSERYRLARMLATHVRPRNNKRLEKKGLLEAYHGALVENVIERITTESGEVVVKFRKEFTGERTPPAELQKFREAFYNEYHTIRVGELSKSKKNENDFWKEMKSVQLKVSESFWDERQQGMESRLPDDFINKTDIDNFFNDLVFAVNQPDEIELGNLIATEIGEYFNLIDNEMAAGKLLEYMSTWMTKIENGKAPFLTKTDVKKFFDDIKKKIYTLEMIGPTLIHKDEVNKFNISFRETLTELHEFLKSTSEPPRNLICNFVCAHDTVVGSIKVLQILKELGTYEAKDSYIFMRLRAILCLEEGVIESFKSTTNLLVIECNTKESAERLDALFEKLKNVIFEKNKNKKVILITLVNDLLAERFDQDEACSNLYTKIEDKEISFDDLDEKSREKILKENNIIFQGKETDVRSVVGDQSTHLLRGDVLTMLIKNQKIEISKAFMDSFHNEVEEYFIDRTFLRNIEIKKDFHEYENFFIVDDKTRDIASINPSNKDIVSISDTSEVFEQLCQKFTQHNIHWLKKEKHFDQFIWQESRGDLKELHKFADVDWNVFGRYHEYKPEKITDILDRVVLLTAEPGMGKSVVLSHLALKTQSLSPSMWIIRCNLNYYCTNFKKWKTDGTDINMPKAMKFLCEIADFQNFKYSDQDEQTKNKIHGALTEENAEIPTETMEGTGLSLLEIKLFIHFFHRGKVLLLFDGVDEICPTYKDLVVKLLTIFKNYTKVEKIWLTTRPFIQSELENEFNTFSYKLKPLVEKEQNDFCKKFWRKTMELELEEFDEKRANVFIKDLSNEFSKSIDDICVQFLTIPLQIYMVATVFSENFAEFYFHGDKELSSEDKRKLAEMDLATLYEYFLNTHFDVQQRKLHDYDRYRDTPEGDIDIQKKRAEFREKHEILAVYSIFGEDRFEKNLPGKESEIRKLIEGMIKAEMKTGSICRIVDHKPQFTHRTFAEYLVASYIWKKFESISLDDCKKEFIPNIIIDVLIRGLEKQVPRFLQSISKKHVYGEGDFSKWKSKMEFLLEKLVNQIGRCTSETFHGFHSDHEERDAIRGGVWLSLVEGESFYTKYAEEAIMISKLLLGIIEFFFQKNRDEQRLMENLTTEYFEFEQQLSQMNWCDSLLWIAAEYNYRNIVQVLVKKSLYCAAWKDKNGEKLMQCALQKSKYDVLKTCLEFGILDCSLSPYRSDDKTINNVLPLHRALQNHASSEVIKLLIENTDIDLLNTFIDEKRELPFSDIMILELLTYDDSIEIIKLAVEKGLHFSFSMNIFFSELYTTCFEIPVDKLIHPRYHRKYVRPVDHTFNENTFSNSFSIIELLLKSADVGYSYSDERNSKLRLSMPLEISTFDLVCQIYSVHKFINQVYELHKRKSGKNCDPRQIMLKLLIDYIRSIGFKRVKIVINRDNVFISPHYEDDELPIQNSKRIWEIIHKVISNFSFMKGFKFMLNSNDDISTVSFLHRRRESLAEFYPFPDQVIMEMFFEHYRNGDGRVTSVSFLDKLREGFAKYNPDEAYCEGAYNFFGVTNDKPGSQWLFTNAFVTGRRHQALIIFFFRDYQNRGGDLWEIVSNAQIIYDMEETMEGFQYILKDRNDLVHVQLQPLAMKLLFGFTSLHFHQGYKIADAAEEISERAKKFENRINKLLDMQTMILDYDDILEILDLNHIDCENVNLQHLIPELDLYPEILGCLIDVYMNLSYVGQKKVMEVFEQMRKYSDQSKRIFELYEKDLHKSYESLIHAVESNKRDMVSNVLENVKQGFVKAVINGLDKELGSPLHYAVFNGQAEITSILLRNGANANLQLCNNAEKIKYFPRAVEKMKKNPFLPNNFINWTPLYFAVLNDHRDIVRELMKYGAVVNPVLDHHSQDGYTPLHISALTSGHLEIARLLLEKGALYNVSNKEDKTPLNLATSGSDVGNLLCSVDRLFRIVEERDINGINSVFERLDIDSWEAVLNAKNTHNKTLLELTKNNDALKDIFELLSEKLRSVKSRVPGMES